MSKIECNCKKCLELEDENGIENLERCEFCGHYFIDWIDKIVSCDCKEGQNKKKRTKVLSDFIYDFIVEKQEEFINLTKKEIKQGIKVTLNKFKRYLYTLTDKELNQKILEIK